MRPLLILIIDLYRVTISPLLGPACRFSPTCSQYAREAVAKHGVRYGVSLGARRLVRCNPWHPGGFDPVP